MPPPRAYYTIPTIVSAGPDGVLDLAPTLAVGGPNANDNIFSFQLRGE